MKLHNLRLKHARSDQQMERSQCDKRDGCPQHRLQLHLNLNLNFNLKLQPILRIQLILKLLHTLKGLYQVQSILTHLIALPRPLHNDLRTPTNLEGSIRIILGPQAISNPMGLRVLRSRRESDHLTENQCAVLSTIIKPSIL